MIPVRSGSALLNLQVLDLVCDMVGTLLWTCLLWSLFWAGFWGWTRGHSSTGSWGAECSETQPCGMEYMKPIIGPLDANKWLLLLVKFIGWLSFSSICSPKPARLAANGRCHAGSEAGVVWNGLAERVLQTGRAITAWIITHWRGDTTRPADQQSSCEVIIKQ